MIRAMVMGPTGAAGSEVVRQCLTDPRIASVLAVSRRPLGVTHRKLRVALLGDFRDFSSLSDELARVDVCFCALGVSRVDVRDPRVYREISHDYPLAAARVLITSNEAARFCFVSGREADPSSRRLYVRVKGETESDLRALLGDRLVVFRPGYIHPVRPRERRAWQDTLFGHFVLMRPLLPGFVTDTVELARSMIHAAVSGGAVSMFDNRGIRAAASDYVRTLPLEEPALSSGS